MNESDEKRLSKEAELDVVVVHPGTQHAPQLAAQLERLGLLKEFRTTIGFGDDSFVSKVLNSKLKGLPYLIKRGRNRTFPGVSARLVRAMPSVELKRLVRSRLGYDDEQNFYKRNKDFQENIPDEVLRSADAVIGFDTSSWIIAEKCRRFRVPFILDRSINHPDHLKSVKFAATSMFPNVELHYKERFPLIRDAEAIEHDLADLIIVGSSFARDSLIAVGCDSSKVLVNPYGVDVDDFARNSRTSCNLPQKFRFLFAGTLGMRKGIRDILEVWSELKDHLQESELWIAGDGPDLPHLSDLNLDRIKLLGRLAKSEMPSVFVECDAFILPSYAEGFGLVLLEALSSGLKVIASRFTAGPDLRENVSSEHVALIDAGDHAQLRNAMIAAYRDTSSKAARQASCLPEIQSYYTWDAYGDRWKRILSQIQH